MDFVVTLPKSDKTQRIPVPISKPLWTPCVSLDTFFGKFKITMGGSESPGKCDFPVVICALVALFTQLFCASGGGLFLLSAELRFRGPGFMAS